MFQSLSSSPSSDPFLCLYCKTIEQDKEIQRLKSTITKLEHELAQSTPAQDAVRGAPNSARRSYAGIVSGTQPPNLDAYIPELDSQPNRASNSERKFNVVVYGIKECNKGTSRQDRVIQDTDNATSIIAKTDDHFTAQSIRDCLRLGKYTESRNRPTLIKLTRAQDVTNILANRKKLAACPGISIKPDMNARERAIENILLRKRRELIISGQNGSKIKLRGNSLFVNKKKYGTVTGSLFTAVCEEEVPMEPDNTDPTGEEPQLPPPGTDSQSEN